MIRYLLGDTRACLRQVAERSVQCVATSPPYWGLRDYGVEATEWADGWTGCLGLEPSPEMYVAHLVEVFREVRRVLRDDGVVWLNLGDCYATGAGRVGEARGGGAQGARWAGDVGRHRDGRRRDPGERFQRRSGTAAEGIGPMTQPNRLPIEGLKPKDLVGIPFRVAFALQADGWYLRAICPWVKRNCMPESTRDRPTTACEYVFLLAKSETYFYDVDAVRIAPVQRPQRRNTRKPADETPRPAGQPQQRWPSQGPREEAAQDCPAGGRQFRNSDPFFTSLRLLLDGAEALVSDEDGDPVAFVVNPKPFKGAHFAVWPPELVEPMIKAGTSEHGACSACGAPWKRRTGRPCKACGAFVPTHGKSCPDCGHVNDWKAERGISADFGTTDWSTPGRATPRKLTADGKQAAVPAQQLLDAGWQSGCSCNAPVRPCVVLDPFSGSGTTQLVAERLGRDSVYVDVKPDYLDMAKARHGGVPTPEVVDDEVEPLPLDVFLAELRRAP